MDVLKSAITFIVGAAVALYGFDQIEYSRDRQRARQQAEYDAKRSAVAVFREASLRYREAALDAYVDLYDVFRASEQGEEILDKTPAMQRYESTAYDDFLNSVELLKLRFVTQEQQELQLKLKMFLEVSQARHEIYDQLVDIGVEFGTPVSKRGDFNSYLVQYSTLRDSILVLAEDYLISQY